MRAAVAAKANSWGQSTPHSPNRSQRASAAVSAKLELQLELDLSIHKIIPQSLPDHLKQKYKPKYINGYYQDLFPDLKLGQKEYGLLRHARKFCGISAKLFREFLIWTKENWERAISCAKPCKLDPPKYFDLVLVCSKYNIKKFHRAYIRRDKPPSFTLLEAEFIRSLMKAGANPKYAVMIQNHYYLLRRLARFNGGRRFGSMVELMVEDANKTAFRWMHELGYAGQEFEQAERSWKWGEENMVMSQ